MSTDRRFTLCCKERTCWPFPYDHPVNINAHWIFSYTYCVRIIVHCIYICIGCSSTCCACDLFTLCFVLICLFYFLYYIKQEVSLHCIHSIPVFFLVTLLCCCIFSTLTVSCTDVCDSEADFSEWFRIWLVTTLLKCLKDKSAYVCHSISSDTLSMNSIYSVVNSKYLQVISSLTKNCFVIGCEYQGFCNTCLKQRFHFCIFIGQNRYMIQTFMQTSKLTLYTVQFLPEECRTLWEKQHPMHLKGSWTTEDHSMQIYCSLMWLH